MKPTADLGGPPSLPPAETAPIAAESVTPRPTARSPKVGPGRRSSDRFPVVALCGSAGALEAFERFFAHLPPSSGLAFVVVVHRAPDPEQSDALTQVLQGFTQLPVAEAHDGLRVRPNHVYVIPPGHDLSLLHGSLFLLKPTQPASRRLPIDFFLQTLAKDVGERAVCIIFSGLGSDGTIGLKMVMENFGMVMAQDPETAAFDAMPRAAMATEFVDFVLAPELMPTQLLDYLERPLEVRPLRNADEETASQPSHALQKIFLLIRNQTGHDFSFYKRNTVFRRIERRMNSHQIREFTHYVRYLQENPAEVELLFHELLIGVTKFFRDPEAFASLKEHLRPILADKEPDSTVRVWAPGCSTGEEAYSLAMTLFECLGELAPDRHLKLQIFATDISPDGISFARVGQYSENIEADVSPARLARFFQKADGHYQIRKEVRDVVVFALHNINKDAPFIKLDLLVCRNLLIYLNAELQRSLLPVFHYALNPKGLLFLGPSENITGYHDLFQPLDVKWKISRRSTQPASLPHLIKFPFSLARHSAAPPTTALMSASTPHHRQNSTFAALVQKKLLQSYAPPAVVINTKGEILYVNGRTGKYLEPAPGLSGMNLFEMAREELNFEISGAVHRATQSQEDVTVDNVRVRTDTGQQLLRLSVWHLSGSEALAGLLLVVFEDQPTPRKVRLAKKSPQQDSEHRDAVVAALDKELQYTKHRLQTTVEEMESSLEELKSTNEELQSANEELQSTNEEAMTNKEEMQSLNEELMTLNMQYLAKTEELGQTANDMKNLLDATEIAIIFLDNDLVIKRFTPQVGRIISLLPTDVGRPLAHFTSSLRSEHLLRDVQQVLDRLTSIETSIQTTRGEWYTMRILPYRSLDNYINGAVLTFTDITALKLLEARLQETARFAESMLATVREPQLALDASLTIVSANQAFADIVREPLAALAGRPLASLGGMWQQPALQQQLQQLLDPAVPTSDFDGLALEGELPGQGRRRVVLYGSRLLHHGQATGQLMLAVREVAKAT
ncbi:chemotaxis protein CheB [Hymenobacter ginsengisoli]|uniref:protein-glutamate O-methyltransferase n=1 Tax=Hymenobacter ginsengisoli TaxID=1051626 RepID=A0ABP8QFI3_9BACT|nr:MULTISPECIES: CheR family methyltransferase [unclassified Hymenobacter]MBO2030223.1 PAS domain-containing protein [Hymenobacter sp. BT559]